MIYTSSSSSVGSAIDSTFYLCTPPTSAATNFTYTTSGNTFFVPTPTPVFTVVEEMSFSNGL